MVKVKIQRRKNYSVREDLAGYLGQCSLELENGVGRSVPRQLIIDTLIETMRDDAKLKLKIYSKIENGQR